MSVNTTTSRIAYTGDGSTVGFTYNFKILDATHLDVYLDGVLQTTGYSVSGVGAANGGAVTFSTAPANGASVVLLRDVPFTQPVTTVDNQTILASVLDTALDRLTMLVQQVWGYTSRALQISPTDDATVNMTLPDKATRANKYFLFDANGAPSVVNSQIDARYYGAASSDPTTRPDGSARQAGDLYFNSVTQQFRGWSGAAWNNALPSAALTLTNFTETAATAKTTFTITGGYTVGAVFVYLNGVLLFPNEYTASNGTTVVLNAACAIGDEFRAISYNNFSVADTLSKASNFADLPSVTTALTNLGFSSFVQGLRALTTAATFRSGIGAAQEGGITTASVAPATLVTAAESIAANNNDTTIPTSAAVKAYADSAVSGAALGVGQSWQDLTASRALSTSYQNTTGRPISVAVLCSGTNNTTVLQVSTNNSTWVDVGRTSASASVTLYVTVPNNHYYRLNGTNSFTAWSELR